MAFKLPKTPKLIRNLDPTDPNSGVRRATSKIPSAADIPGVKQPAATPSVANIPVVGQVAQAIPSVSDIPGVKKTVESIPTVADIPSSGRLIGNEVPKTLADLDITDKNSAVRKNLRDSDPSNPNSNLRQASGKIPDAGDVFGGDGVGEYKPPAGATGSPYKNTYEQTQAPGVVTAPTTQAPSIVGYRQTAYNGRLDAGRGAGDVRTMERGLGIQGFDKGGYQNARAAALRASVDDSVRQEGLQADQAAANSGLGNSGMNRALQAVARAKGSQTMALGGAQIAADAEQIGQADAARRTGQAMGMANANLQNAQFGANFTSGERRFTADNQRGQRQFNAGFTADQRRDARDAAIQQGQYNATFADSQNRYGAATDMDVQRGNEDNRRYGNEESYGRYRDSYEYNQLAPQQRRDARRAAMLQAGTQVASSALGMGASFLPIPGAK